MYDLAVGGGGTYALPLGGPRWASLVFTRTERRFPGEGAEEQQLGTRQISGLETIGRLFTIPDNYTIAVTSDNGWTGLVFAERNGQATNDGD